jgi:uncharacterized membrane protein
MRSITDQNGTKWTVSVYSSGFSLGEPEHMSVITLSFEPDEGKTRYRTAGGSLRERSLRSLDAFSDGELLALLNNTDEDL